MERFRVKGSWSTDPNIEAALPGILTFSPTAGLTLALDGAFAKDYPGPDAYDALYGVVDDAKFGRFVKLTRCLRTKSTVVLSGSSSEEVAPAFAFFASQPFNENEILATGATAGFEHLNEWAGAGRGLRLEAPAQDGAFTLTYEPAPAIQCTIDTGTVELRFSPFWRRTSSFFRVQERASFRYDLPAAVSVEQLLHRHIRPVQDFLTFAVDRPTAVTQLSVSSGGEDSNSPSPIAVLYKPTYTAARRTEPLGPEMLFHLADIQPHLDTLLNEWFALHRLMTAFFGAFLGLVYAPPKFAEIRFDWTLHCAALLFASGRDSSPLSTVHAADESVEWLLESVGDLGTMVIDNGPVFVAHVRDARSRVHHGMPIDGVQLHWLTEGLRSLMKAFLLKRLTPTAPMAHALLERRPAIAYTARQLHSFISKNDDGGAQQ